MQLASVSKLLTRTALAFRQEAPDDVVRELGFRAEL